MSATDPASLSAFFNEACNTAALETLPRFRNEIIIENKLQTDFDPVTQADRAAELAVRKLIEQHYPEHDIIGEEFGSTNNGSSYRWIIDPIDGTRAFISGIPVWGTLIGLYHNDKPIAGVLDQPYIKERFIAISRNGTISSQLFHSGDSVKTLNTRTTLELAEATLLTTSPHLLTNNRDQAYFKLEEKVKLFRYGCDCYAYAMVAAGQIDLVVESGLNIYDIAALIPIVEGAGGCLLYTSPSPRDKRQSRMPSSA